MTNEEFISTIQQVHNTDSHMDLLVDFVKSSPNRLIEIFKLIPKNQELLLKNWQLRSLYERIIRLSSLEIGSKNISITHKIFNECYRKRDKYLIASILASNNDSHILISELLNTKSNKLLQLVIHELISRGIDLREYSTFNQIEKVNVYSQFANLSLYPLEVELNNDFPSYTLNGGGHGISFGFQHNERYSDLPSSKFDISYNHSEEIINSINHWCKDSNGISLGYIGKFETGVCVENIINQVPEFEDSTQVRIRIISPSIAYAHLFNAASNGGAYSQGYYGAVGRLLTWRCINSMITLKDFFFNTTTYDIMQEFEWYEFNTNSWFINEWLDLGIIAINRTTNIFGIIAGTDTD